MSIALEEYKCLLRKVKKDPDSWTNEHGINNDLVVALLTKHNIAENEKNQFILMKFKKLWKSLIFLIKKLLFIYFWFANKKTFEKDIDKALFSWNVKKLKTFFWNVKKLKTVFEEFWNFKFMFSEMENII